MKECPECKRTYADETLTFCLADGSLLSAPFTPPRPTIASPRAEPPTEVMPAHLLPKTANARRIFTSKYIVVGLLCLLVSSALVAFIMSRPSRPEVNSHAPSSGAQAPKNNTPTSAMKAYYDAAKNGDIQRVKNFMSKSLLDILAKRADRQNKSLDYYLQDVINRTPPPSTMETRNEKITGDTATIEVTNEKGDWETVNLVQEDGQWKFTGK